MELVFCFALAWMDYAVSRLPTKFALEQRCIFFPIIIVIEKHTTTQQSIFLDSNPNFGTNLFASY